MTNTHQLGDPPRTTSRRATGTTRNTAGSETLAQPGTPDSIETQENQKVDVTNGQPHGCRSAGEGQTPNLGGGVQR